MQQFLGIFVYALIVLFSLLIIVYPEFFFHFKDSISQNLIIRKSKYDLPVVLLFCGNFLRLEMIPLLCWLVNSIF